MKCVKCGAELVEGDHFCHKCGARVMLDSPKVQFCRECGSPLEEGSNYCPKCGTKVSVTSDVPAEKPEQLDKNEEWTDDTSKKEMPEDSEKQYQPWSLSGIREQVIDFWDNLDLFLKCSTISLATGISLLLISVCISNGGASFISILQILSTLAGILMHKNIVVVGKAWLKYLYLFICIPLVFLNLNCYTVKTTHSAESTPPTSQETTAETRSNVAEVPQSSALLYGEPLEDVESAFRTAGFTNIQMKEKTLSGINCLEAVDTVDSVTIGGISTFDSGWTFPVDSPVMIYYLKAQKAKNIVSVYIDFSENLFFSRYDVSLTMDDYSLGSLPHGTSKKFTLNLNTGSHVLEIKSADNPEVSGKTEFDISETSDMTIRVVCHSDSIEVAQTYYESKRELQENEARVPQSADYYSGKIYSDVISELKKAGFTNINTSVFHDITGGWFEAKEGEIESITICGKADFIKSEVFLKDDPVIIQYHAQAYTQQEMQEKIWMSAEKPANEILAYFKETPCSVECFLLGKKMDSFEPDGYFLESGTVSDDGKSVVLNFTNPELTAMKETLESSFPKDMAIRVAVTSMTNGQATDVFMADGMTYNTQKFHKYSDISGAYLYPYEIGTWIVVNENTWRVEDMKCMISGFKTAINVSADVTFSGGNYTLSDVDKIIAGKEYIDSGDTDNFVTEHYDTPDEAPFLTVQPYLVSEGRDATAEQERNNRTMPTDVRTKWINSQFSWYSRRNEQFEKIIKRNLNDEKSFKESETTYIDIINEDTLQEINATLQSGGYSNRCKIGDLLIICKFTAKNAFNATIKSTAIGISSYDSHTITLVGIG